MMKYPAYFEYGNPLRIIAGENVLPELPALLGSVAASHLMIIADPGVVESGGLDLVYANMASEVDLGPVIKDAPVNSDVREVHRIAQLFTQANCDAILAVGGGSVIDTAKAVNILAVEGGADLTQSAGYNILKRPLYPLIAVPTTAGSGSEVTCTAVIADPEAHRNWFFTSPFILPAAALIDARMTVSLPLETTSTGAMSVLSHAVEAFISLAANPFSRANAASAIRLISTELGRVMRSSKDLSGRFSLSLASALARMAAPTGMTGMITALAHGLSVLCQVPYSQCSAVLLPYGLEFNLNRIKPMADELLLHLAGPDLLARTPHHLRVEQLIKTVRAMNRKLRDLTHGKHAVAFKYVTDSFGRARIPQDIFSAAAKAALNNCSLFFNPEKVGQSELVRILEHAWDGRPLEKASSK